MKTCPSIEDLRRFAVGDMSDEEFTGVSDHVAQCSSCGDVLASLDHYEDGLVSELRQMGAPSVAKVPSSVIEAAQSVSQSLRSRGMNAEATRPAVLDPGRALANRLDKGPVRIGRFELQAVLGDGAFGYVFRARDPELERDVAVKVGRAGDLSGDDEVRAFFREARAAAQLSHPNIVAIYDSGQTDDGVCFLVSELIEGETLEARLRREQFAPEQAAALLVTLAEAMAYAHSHEIIHRDIKPSNIILDEAGAPHVADFGLAKRLDAHRSEASKGKILGTPAYMSPEQARGDSHSVDSRSDVYSLGVVLYELMTGERPFQGRGRQALLQVLDEEPRNPRVLNERVPRDLETICLKAMAKSPQRRYASAGAFALDLQRFLDGETIDARPVGWAERLWRWCRRFPLATSVLAAVVVGSIVGFAFLIHLSTWFVRETALDGVRREADLFEGVNEFYSEEVLDIRRLQAYWDKGSGHLDQLNAIKITHEYAKTKNALPYPKTFTIDAGKRISERVTGMQVRLYSDRPWRAEGGPQNEFERVALATFREQQSDTQPVHEYHKFSEVEGRPMVQYARAQIMQENCVNCHNSHLGSPRNDWKVGDVVGVLAITRPLARDIQRTRAGLRGAFMLVAATGAGLLVILLVLLPRRRRRGGVA